MRTKTVNKFDEYKFFIEDTARFSERKQNLANTFMNMNFTVFSILVGIITIQGLFGRDYDQSTRVGLSVVQIMLVFLLLGVGIFICVFWYQNLRKYQLVLRLRYSQLWRMEEHPDMVDSHKMFHAEEVLYPRNADGSIRYGEGLNFSDVGNKLPAVFIGVYVLFGLIMLFSLILEKAPTTTSAETLVPSATHTSTPTSTPSMTPNPPTISPPHTSD